MYVKGTGLLPYLFSVVHARNNCCGCVLIPDSMQLTFMLTFHVVLLCGQKYTYFELSLGFVVALYCRQLLDFLHQQPL